MKCYDVNHSANITKLTFNLLTIYSCKAMPNWCSNTIIIAGPTEVLHEFSSKLDLEKSKKIFSFAQTVPIPNDQEENWYEWNNENWGTKWDAYDAVVKINLDNIIIQCETAWSPPENWAKNYFKTIDPVYQDQVKITLAFCEMGCAFYGNTIITTKGCEYHVYEMTDEDWNSNIDHDYWETPKEGTFFKQFIDQYKIRSYGG